MLYINGEFLWISSTDKSDFRPAGVGSSTAISNTYTIYSNGLEAAGTYGMQKVHKTTGTHFYMHGH